MHSVVVEDPWFGPYIQVQGPDVYTTIRPIVVIGPLFVRVLRVESLDHRGQQLKLNHYHERSVLHNYADGRVTGVIPDDVHPPDGQFWISPTSGQYTYTSPESDPELGEIRIEIKLFVTWKEEELTVTCTLLFEEYLLREPEEDNVLMNKYSITLLGTRDIDPSTGSILYRDFTILVHSQEYQGFSLDDCANPYGAGSDSLGTHLPTLLDYIQQCLWVPHKVKPNRTARDAAIYDAIDNVALANINQLEGVRDLIEFSKLLKSIKGFLRLPGDLQDWLKQFASLHLFWKYVVKTNLMTWEELKKLLAFLTGNWGDVLDKMRNMYLIGHGKDRYTTTVDGYNATVLHNVKVCYGPDMSYFSTIMARLAMLRVVPKFTDMWDMVPYSFVVDWLIPVTDYLTNLENLGNVMKLPFIHMVLTRKVIVELSHSFFAGDHQFTINMEVTDYDRKVLTRFPSDVWLGIRFRDPRKQTLTAFALIVQIW